MKKIILCALYLGLFLNVGFAAEPEDITVVFFDSGYPPFYMANMEEGMVIDFLKAFDEQRPEFTLVFKGLSRKRIDMMMADGTAQASGLTNPMFAGESAQDYLFSDAIWTSGNYIMMKKDSMFHYAGPEDLFGKRLGVIFGNKNGLLDPYIESGKISARPIDTNALLYKTLQLGRVDAIVANKHVVSYEMKLEGIDPSEFVFAEVPLFEFELMTQIQKTHPKLLDALNAFIHTSRENGFLDELRKKYVE